MVYQKILYLYITSLTWEYKRLTRFYIVFGDFLATKGREQMLLKSVILYIISCITKGFWISTWASYFSVFEPLQLEKSSLCISGLRPSFWMQTSPLSMLTKEDITGLSAGDELVHSSATFIIIIASSLLYLKPTLDQQAPSSYHFLVYKQHYDLWG